MNPKVQRVIDHMNANLHRNLALKDLAKLARLSKSRRCCVFKETTGLSVGRYLKSLRMAKARELLETTSLSAKEIRARVGILDQSHFVRDFKKRHDVTPSEYREKKA